MIASASTWAAQAQAGFQGSSPKRSPSVTPSEDLSAGGLREENDTLRCQLEAYKNEVDLLKQENVNSLENKDRQLKGLQQALQGMQKVRDRS